MEVLVLRGMEFFLLLLVVKMNNTVCCVVSCSVVCVLRIYGFCVMLTPSH